MNIENEDPAIDRRKSIPQSPPEPDGDAFPAEEDVSTPPEGSDQAEAEDKE